MSNKNLQYIDVANDFTEEEEAVFRPVKASTMESNTVKLPDPMAKKQPPKASTQESLDALVAAQYRGGMSLKDIRRANDMSSGKIYGILTRMGVPLRTGRYNTASGDKVAAMSNTDKQHVIDSYLAGTPLSYLYRAYSLNKHGLYRILDEANIPRRHKHSPTEAQREVAAVEAKPKVLGLVAEPATFHATIDSPSGKPVIADISKTDTGLHITLNRKYLVDTENINITISVAD